MYMFAASAFLAGLLEGLRLAHALTFVRVALLAPALAGLYGWLLGVREPGLLALAFVLPGWLCAHVGALAGLGLVHWTEAE